MFVARLATLTWITGLVWFWLGAGAPLSATLQGGGHRAYLPLIATPPGDLEAYVVLLTSDRDGDQEVYSVRGDGSNLSQLTFDDTATNEPQFAPNGSMILYGNTDGANEDGFSLMSSDGSDKRLLVQLPGNDDLARWSPDGASIAFRNNNPTTLSFDLYWHRLDKPEPRLVSTGIQSYAWSPDGARLAYTVPRISGNTTLFDLYVHTPAIDETVLLIADTNKSFGWSPDGARLAFSARRDNDNELFVITATGGTLLQLTNNAVDDDFTGWVEGGERIAITRALTVLDTPRNIYLVNPDGSGESRLTNTSDFKQVVSIAPDGKSIVFTRVTESTQSQRLYLQGTRSPTQFAISENICTQTTSAVCGWGAITWTTDGLQLAFHQFQRPRPGQTGQTQNHVYLTTLAGSTTTTELLAENGTSPWWLAGSPYLLLYTPAMSGGALVPHAMDSRNAQRYPLTGEGEDATIYDWRYAPRP